MVVFYTITGEIKNIRLRNYKIKQLKEYAQSKTISEKLIKIMVVASSKKVEFLGSV